VLAVVFHRARQAVSIEDSLLVLTTVFLSYRYYRNQRVELDSERDHASQMAALHIRAIEGLALAVEAKDNLNTRGHLRRVQVYSLAIGREMGLNETEMEALHAGALLHDIGKLAVPDHILTKPGKLTPEEFAKMKVHPQVGAEIVEQVQFPYEVAPIVREHHEKWNGSGYPFGLKGEEISLGARILATVDCLDALTSDREYRKAMPLEEAMDYIVSESGKSFDPSVVDVLRRLYRSLSQEADGVDGLMLSTPAEIKKGAAPDAGLDLCDADSGGIDAPRFLSAIAAARREDNLLTKMATSVAVLEMHEALPRIHRGMKGMIPYDSIAIFLRDANALRLEFVAGIDSDVLSYLEVPMGVGLTGWVAQNRKAVVNGNPAVDPGFACGSAESLKSALSVPLEGNQGLIGILNLYRTEKDAFTGDDLRILNTVIPNVALALENALKYRKSQVRAEIDPVTELLSSGLFLQNVAEDLARARRREEALCVLYLEAPGFERLALKLGSSRTDELLAALGNGLKSACREYDRIARVGTASFAVALAGLRPNHLATILDRIEALTADGDSGNQPTFRFGGALYPDDGDGARHMLEVAQRRARSTNSNWTASIRALADSVGQTSPSEERSPSPTDR
jgi:putative nucleotidyltransferase with HDIG domain/diguanylate cyclase (GGDEF)-like protein